MPAPSFYQLFRRSKYSRFNFDTAPGAERNRRELFAVAALGFVLKHETAFRTEFLKKICGEPNEKGFLILCEEFHCADLILCQKSRGVFYVLEAKIKAKLAKKQNPDRPEFIKGYASSLKKCFPGAKLTYIVLHEGMDLSRGSSVGGIHCQWLSWGNLCALLPESPLVSDLFDSLGALQISGFQLRQFKNKRMGPKTKSAADLFVFITAIAKELRIPQNKIEFDVGNNAESPYFGFNIKPSQIRFRRIREKTKRGISGWIGYERNGKNFEPRIWFYCANDEERDKIQGFCSTLPVLIGDGEGAKFYISHAIKSGDDASWFLTTLRQLGARC
jgi:hypothetical protein